MNMPTSAARAHRWRALTLRRPVVASVALLALVHAGCGGAKVARVAPPAGPVIRRDPEAEELLRIAGVEAACFRVERGSVEVWPEGDRSFDWCRAMSRSHAMLAPMTAHVDAASSEFTKHATIILVREADGAWQFKVHEKWNWKPTAEAAARRSAEGAEGKDIGDVLSAALESASGSGSASGGYGFTLEPAEGQLPGVDGQRLAVHLDQATDLNEEGVVIATIESIGEGRKVLNSLPIRCALVRP